MKKIITTIILSIFIILLSFNIVSAYNLELILSADKNNVNVGDTVTVTLTLSKGMQAADFTINYDSNLLKFENTSLEKNFYNSQEPGKILCSWFDTNDTVNFKFTFTAIASGTAQFTTSTENFYDSNLQAASSYQEGNLNVTLLSASSNIDNNLITPTTPNNSNNANNNNNIPNNNSSSSNIQQIQNTNTNNQNSSNTKTPTNPIQTIDNKKSDEILPQTGDNTIIFVSIAFAIIILAITTKIKLNKLRDI